MSDQEFRADLHCHTIMSDCSVDPRCVVALAKQAKLSALAITDHDTFRGIQEAAREGERLGVKILPGIELSSYDHDRGRKVHILAYGCRYPDALRPVYEYTTSQRIRTGEIMLCRLSEKLGLPPEMLKRCQRGPVLYKQHLMHGMMDAGMAASIFGETFHRYFGKGEDSVSESIPYLDVHQVLRAVREAEGVSVLAHPAEYHSEALMKELIRNREIDGIEAFHESASFTQSAAFEREAREHGLLVTGGTDFHGMYHRIPVPIGSYTIGREDFEKLLLRIY